MADGGRMGKAREGVPVVDEAAVANQGREELRRELTRHLDGAGAGADRVDEEAERALVGAVLNDPRLDGPLAVALRTVRASDFGSDMTCVWESIERLAAAGTEPTLATVAADLRAANRIASVGGVYGLRELAADYSLTTHVEQHALLVARRGLARHLKSFGRRLVAAIDAGTRDPAQVRALAIEHLEKLRVPALPHGGAIGDIDAVFLDLERRLSGEVQSFTATGVDALDAVIGGGLRLGLHFLVARPGIGKTTLTLAMAVSLAARGIATAYFSLEASRLECMQAILCAVAGVSFVRFTRTPHLLTPADSQALTHAANAIAGWPLFIFADDPDASVRAPRRVAEMAAAMAKLPARVGMVFLDNVGEVETMREHREERARYEEIAKALRDLARRDVRCPVVALAHARRSGVAASGLYARPSADHIYGSDALLKVADGVVILHREDKHPTKKENVDNASVRGVVDVLVPKMRGVEDNRFAQLMFHGDAQRFDAYGISAQRARLEADGLAQHHDDVTADFGAEGIN